MTDRPDASEVLDALLGACARYRDRHREWPSQARLDARRMHALASGCTPEGFAVLAAHVRLLVRDGPGLSVGGRGVVEHDEHAGPSASLALARRWLAGVELVAARSAERREAPAANVEFWCRLADRALRAHPDAHIAAEQLVLSWGGTPERLEERGERERADELLSHTAYVASFGIDGVLPKTVHVRRHHPGHRTDDDGVVSLALVRADGRVVVDRDVLDAGHVVATLFDGFPAPRERLVEAAVELGQRLAEVVRGLAR